MCKFWIRRMLVWLSEMTGGIRTSITHLSFESFNTVPLTNSQRLWLDCSNLWCGACKQQICLQVVACSESLFNLQLWFLKRNIYSQNLAMTLCEAGHATHVNGPFSDSQCCLQWGRESQKRREKKRGLRALTVRLFYPPTDWKAVWYFQQ